MTPIIEVRNLVKRYGNSITAVDGVSFAIPPGVCFGLLGPNGAGKTTTIEVIEDILSPTSGEVLYKGARRTPRFREEVGIQFQKTELLSFLTVRETLETFRRFYSRPMAMDTLIELCQLTEILDRDNSRISGGQRQRLFLAMALVNDPELVFLDEPTTGLDPQARRHLWDIVEKIRSRGKTVVLTTHYMDEAQILCDEILIVDQGKIIAEGTPRVLLDRFGSGVTVSLPRSGITPEILARLGDGSRDAVFDRLIETQKTVELHTTRINDCLGALLAEGADLTGVTVRSPNLEDLFLHLTGRHLRD